jgi:3-dehydroquinate synthase
MVFRCAELHLEHTRSGDPFELGSARPLDFGHWSAHRLEEIAKGELGHGEAVAIGIAVDTLYAASCGLVSDLDSERMLTTLEDLGFSLHHWALDWLDVDSALAQFREHVGGELCIIFPSGLGQKVELNEIETATMRRCINALAERKRRKEEHGDDQTDLSSVGTGGTGQRLP